MRFDCHDRARPSSHRRPYLWTKNCYLDCVSDPTTQERRPLRRAICGACKHSNWIPGDLPPLETTPCTKCGHPVILAWRLRQFEFKEIIASGGMGTVYRT